MILRGVEEGDREAVLEICVRTGEAGGDATGVGAPEELTERYAAPYLDLEPGLAFVAVGKEGGVVGYVLGTADTVGFAERFVGRGSVLSVAARKAHAAQVVMPEVGEFPAHLHVDLLPAAQGRGMGRALVEAEVEALAAAGARGVHLVVDPRNAGALAFYPRVGFRELRRDGDGVVFGRVLRGS